MPNALERRRLVAAACRPVRNTPAGWSGASGGGVEFLSRTQARVIAECRLEQRHRWGYSDSSAQLLITKSWLVFRLHSSSILHKTSFESFKLALERRP